ncbi:MAG: HAD-IA family hydrolase [Candidatus Woesearchaeota archaeon]|jgi:HAD superfamily hydrolase (TIGR01549 family)|nr:HAD-IA family hydrolase [Candidatus Woesearchaeota archaeon]MDP7458456.1 HAD-IA family hydrolase [Candidatus Woesearchaeota archaeon]
MKAVLVAAGSGTRIKPYSLTKSKVLTKFLGKELLFYHIDEFVEVGIKDIVIICNRDNIDEIRKETKKKYKKVKVSFVQQDMQLGPAHAIYCAKNLLKDDDFFVFKFADSIHEKELIGELLKCFEKGDCDGAITLRHVKDTRRYGIARLEGDKVVEVIEKPEKNPPSDLGLVGLAILKTKVFFDGIEKENLYLGKKELPLPEYILQEGGNLNYWVFKGKRADVGKPWDILFTNKLLLKRFGSRKESRKIARSAKIGKNCYIGKKAVIEKNVVIKNYASVEGKVGEGSVIDGSVIMESSVIGANCRISSSVIGKNNIIGNGCKTKTNATKVFIKDHYEEPPVKKLGLFTGDNVRLMDDIKSEGGKIVYPHKTIKTALDRDYLVRAVIFDADNTLYNTRQVAPKADMAAMDFFAKQGKLKPKELYTFWKETIVKPLLTETDPHKRHRRYSYELLAKEYKLKNSEAAFQCALSNLLRHIALFPNVGQILSKLKGYTLAIISEDPSDVLIPKIKRLGIDKHFQLILTSDSVGKMKPCKEYIDIAMKALWMCPYECVFIGDSYEKDLAIPQELGAKTIILGEKGKINYAIKDFKEILEILEEM